ncbi:hypothetical protein SE957_17370 [Escherichia coli]|nr:hypothetical protein [Escherichia coli]
MRPLSEGAADILKQRGWRLAWSAGALRILVAIANGGSVPEKAIQPVGRLIDSKIKQLFI